MVGEIEGIGVAGEIGGDWKGLGRIREDWEDWDDWEDRESAFQGCPIDKSDSLPILMNRLGERVPSRG